MRWASCIFVLLLSWGGLCYADSQKKSLPNVEVAGEPSSIVAGCVNAITGTFSESDIDIVIPAAEPLTYQRFYCSLDWNCGVLCDSWTYNCARGVWLSHEGSEYTYRVDEATGCKLNYRGGKLREEKVKNRGKVYYIPLRRVDGQLLPSNFIGSTNTGTGEISGRTNIKNQSIHYEASSKRMIATLGDGCVRTFASQWPLSDKRQLPIQFLIESEQRRSGNQSLYEYQWVRADCAEGHRKQIFQIKTADSTGQKVYARLGFDYSGIHQPSFHTIRATANDGREIVLDFQDHSIRIKNDLWVRWYLTRVQRPNAPEVSYDYIAHRDWTRKQMCSKTLGDRLVQQIAYYHGGDNAIGDSVVKIAIDDWRDGKVSVLKGPVGTDETPIVTHGFFYSPGQTEVRDGANHRTLYRYNDQARLNAIDHFTGQSDYQLYSAQRYFWDDTNLICKGFLYPNGIVRSCVFLEYDSKHNITAEHTLGNLSGTNTIDPEYTEGKPCWNGCECYTILRSYTQDSYNRIASETLPNGLITEFHYVPNTHLISAKLIKENSQILLREFYSYDAYRTLIKTIVDDGCGHSPDDLTGVTTRKITYTTPHDGDYGTGLPKVVAEYYLDLETGLERPLGHIINSYSIEGWVIREEHYDANSVLRFVITREHDKYGNVVFEQDAIGQVTQRRYDCFGNKLWEQGPDLSFHFEYVYDYSNRLIAEERVCSDGQRFKQAYRYDTLGNKIATIDIYGHETQFRYDDFGRLIETIYPSCGQDASLRSIQEYDIAGNIISVTDVDGNTTRNAYNIRGQKTSIVHPDGSTERFVYNLDGTLRQQTAVNGTSTHLTYDILGNCIQKDTYSASGELLATSSAIYHGKTLISETDANGNITRYQHDGAGRPVAIYRPDSYIRYIYDSLGRKVKTIEGERVRVVEYDLLNRVVEERVEDYEGTVYTRLCYGYDAAGRRTCITTFTDQGPSTTQSFYNSHGQVCRIVDAEGNETLTHFDYWFVNEFGQRVPQTIQVDPLGKQTVTTYDVLGRAVSVVQKDPFNQEIAKTLSSYDGRGNLIRRTDLVKAEGRQDREMITEWRYDALGRLIELIEGAGTPQRRASFYNYNAYGQKQDEFFIDGLLISYSYDAFGRMQRYESSDQSFCYTYTYDPVGNITEVVDECNGSTTTRAYDTSNRLIRETLGNGLTLAYQYDPLGRLTRLTIPDGSAVDYIYNAAHLRTVARIDTDGKRTYVHRYLAYDLGGNVTKSQLIGNGGELAFERDKLSRILEIKTPAFHETIPPGGYDTAGNLVKKIRSDALGEQKYDYGYDTRYQITSEEGHTYQYDSLDNRLNKDSHTCDIDALNQMVRQGEHHYAYDARGNRVSSDSTHYSYDALGRLTSVTIDGERYTYTYDAFNRRLSKTSSQGTERYLYQEQMEIGAVSDEGRVVQFRALGQGLGAEIAAAVILEIKGRTYAPVHDHSGHVVAIVDADSGEVAETYRYSVFGEEAHISALNPWRYSSKRMDSETGLVYFGRRYYDPVTGRWMTPDPAGYEDGPNLFAYVHNSPLTHFDLYGLFTRTQKSYQRRSHSLSDAKWYHCSWFEKAHALFIPSRNYRVWGQRLEHGAICFTNGMNNLYSQAIGHAAHISRLAGNCKVHGTHNQTHGVISDLIECGLGYLGITTDPVILLHRKWNKLLANHGTLMEICTSQGALHVRNALATYPPEMRNRILVLALAPAAYIPAEFCKQVWHYRNEDASRDFIPFTDKKGAQRAQREGTLREVKSVPGAPLFDHSVSSPTYEPIIKRHSLRYESSGGQRI